MQRKGICKNMGICNNANAHKEIVINDDNAEFVCPECGEPLEPLKEDVIPTSNGKPRPILIAVIAGVILLVAIILWLSVGGNSEDVQADKIAVDSTLTEKADSAKSSLNMDSIAQAKADSIVAARAITDSIAAKAIADSIKLAQADSILAASKKASTARNTVSNGNGSKRTTARAKSSTNGKLRLSYGSYSGDVKNGYPDGMGRLTYSTSRQINRFDSKRRMASAGDYVIGEFVRGFFVQGKHFDSNGNLIETLMIGVPANDSYDNK